MKKNNTLQKGYLLLISAISVLLIATTSVFGQTERDTTGSKTLAIPLSEITSVLEKTNGFLSEINTFLSNRQELDDVQSNFLGLDSLILKEFENLDTANITPVEIASFAGIFSRYLRQIDGFEKILNNRTSSLDQYKSEINEEERSWKVTEESLYANESSETVLENIKSILSKLDLADKDIVAQIDIIFKSLNGISKRKILIQNGINQLDRVRQISRQKFFSIDSSPIWKIHQDSLEFSNFHSEIKVNGGKAIENFVKYSKQNIELIIINVIIILLLMFLIIYLKQKQEKLVHYNDQEELWMLFNHPLGLAILLGLLVFAPPYEFFPKIAGDFVLLVVYWIVVWMVFKVVSKKYRWYLLLLGVFLTFNSFVHLISHFSIFGRILLLAEAGLGLYTTIKILKPGLKSYTFYNQAIGKWMLYLLPVSILTFGLAIITNFIGDSSFTEFLLYSTTKSIALGVLFLAGVLVLSGMFTILIRTPQAKTVYIVKEHSEVLEHRTKQLIQLGMYLLFLSFVLNEFEIRDDILVWFNSILDYNIGYGERDVSIRGIFAFFITILVSWWIAKLLRLVLEKELFSRMLLPRGIPGAISTSIYFFIIVIGFFIALSQAGVDLNQISIIIGALSVGIGFGLQNIISNFVSGIILVFERPIQEGDTVEIGTMLGDVKSIGIRASKIRTYDGSEVVVPNNNLINNEVINWTLSDRKRRSTIEVGVAYGTNPGKVSEILENLALTYPKTLKDPKPLVIFKGFGDSSLNFKLHFWTYFEDGYTSKSEVSIQIYDAFEKAGIQIPFPQRVVTMAEPTDRSLETKKKKPIDRKRPDSDHKSGPEASGSVQEDSD